MLPLDRSRLALLIMDFQETIVTGYATDQEALLANASEVLTRARSLEIPVLYVVVGFRAGYPEISPHNALFSSLKESGRFLSDGVHPAVAPQSGDVVVTKHRVSAFAGTDLDMILRAQQRDTLVLMGISTSGVVLSTVRHAADADYRLVVLRDCCSDPDPEVHRVLLDKVLARQADVITAADFLCAC